MADQATVSSPNGPAGTISSGTEVRSRAGRAAAGDASPAAVMSNVASFGENLLTLAELQTRLAAIELRQNVVGVKVAGALLLAGVLFAVAALPILLAGLSELLVLELAIRRGFALLIVAVGALLIGGLLAAVAAALLRRSPLGFPLTTEELTRNIQWIRTVLQHSGRERDRH
jgi:hypothetical protein